MSKHLKGPKNTLDPRGLMQVQWHVTCSLQKLKLNNNQGSILLGFPDLF